MEFHSLSLEDVYKELKSSDKGLNSEEAKKRLEEFGPNELEEKEMNELEMNELEVNEVKRREVKWRWGI